MTIHDIEQARQTIDNMANTYFRILQETVVNSTIYSNVHKEEIEKAADNIISESKKYIENLRNEWQVTLFINK